MKHIPLTNSESLVLVDDEDYEYLSQRKWCLVTNRNGDEYAYSTTVPYIMMHRVIMNTPAELKVDHINFNGLDNRKENLRNATKSENGQNRSGAQRNSKTGVRGVSWHVRSQKYVVQVKLNGVQGYYGIYPTLEEAEAVAIVVRQQLHPYSQEARR